MLSSADADNEAPVLVGSSVHNQRVERFNRDINRNIRQVFATLFYRLESEGVLDLIDACDIFALHYVFIPRINASLYLLAACHNEHKNSSESNKTPLQLLYLNDHLRSQATGSHMPVPQNSTTNVRDLLTADPQPTPPVEAGPDPISIAELQQLVDTVPPMTEDTDSGLTVYKAVREYVQHIVGHYT